jgi:hypothetical protein
MINKYRKMVKHCFACLRQHNAGVNTHAHAHAHNIHTSLLNCALWRPSIFQLTSLYRPLRGCEMSIREKRSLIL